MKRTTKKPAGRFYVLAIESHDGSAYRLTEGHADAAAAARAAARIFPSIDVADFAANWNADGGDESHRLEIGCDDEVES